MFASYMLVCSDWIMSWLKYFFDLKVIRVDKQPNDN